MKQPENKHLTIGKIGEEIAVKFLLNKGFKIIGRNYWKPWGEIDIVAKKGNILHFVEVKTVSRERLEEGDLDDWEPEDNVHSWKKQRLARIIETYLSENHISADIDFEIAVISVYLNEKGDVIKIGVLDDVKLE